MSAQAEAVRQQYLKAMGIPNWQQRYSQVIDVVPADTTSQSSADAMPKVQADVQALAIPRDTGFCSWLLEQQVALFEPDKATGNRRVLLLSDAGMGVESGTAASAPLFTPEERALLQKILSAIGLSTDNCMEAVLCQPTGQINTPSVADQSVGHYLGQSYSPPASFSDCLASRNLVLVIFLIRGDAIDGTFVQRDVERLGHHSAQLARSFHPNSLLQSPALKGDTWASLRRLKPWLSQQVTGADFANHAT